MVFGAPDERDRQAEAWLRSWHGRDWWIGDASLAEWEAAYAAVDAKAGR